MPPDEQDVQHVRGSNEPVVPDPLAATALPIAALAHDPGGFDQTATLPPSSRPAKLDDNGAALQPGRRLAHFRVDALLGEGGMGQVYRATDLALDRPVALKVLPPNVAADASRRERLIREARAQAKINHPNVCHIYFIGEQDGLLFFAMELVEGETLAERLTGGAAPLRDALEWIRMAVLGLQEADRLGYIHRDIKPSNLMLDRHGQVRIVDFGLVAARGAAAAPDAAESPSVHSTLAWTRTQVRNASG